MGSKVGSVLPFPAPVPDSRRNVAAATETLGAGVSETLDDLIARLEAATEGDDRFDYEIQEAMGIPKGQYPGTLDPPIDYTRSIDAALELVPEGWRDDIDLELSLGEFGKQLGAKSCFACLATGHVQTPSTKQVTAHAHTPPLALCIAALRARQAQP